MWNSNKNKKEDSDNKKPPAECCGEVIVNSAGGKDFWVCRKCKQEIKEGHKKPVDKNASKDWYELGDTQEDTILLDSMASGTVLTQGEVDDLFNAWHSGHGSDTKITTVFPSKKDIEEAIKRSNPPEEHVAPETGGMDMEGFDSWDTDGGVNPVSLRDVEKWRS